MRILTVAGQKVPQVYNSFLVVCPRTLSTYFVTDHLINCLYVCAPCVCLDSMLHASLCVIVTGWLMIIMILQRFQLLTVNCGGSVGETI